LLKIRNKNKYFLNVRLINLETDYSSLLDMVRRLKSLARGRADSHEKYQESLEKLREDIQGHRDMYENYGKLARRDDDNVGQGKGE
jgi:hypothetical protein